MNTDRIAAAEAARQIADKLLLADVTSLWIEDIVKAAIEKAIKEHDKEQHYYAALGEAESRAAHASENVISGTSGTSEAANDQRGIHAACFPATSENKTAGVQVPATNPAHASEQDTKRLDWVLRFCRLHIHRAFNDVVELNDRSDIDAAMSQTKEKE